MPLAQARTFFIIDVRSNAATKRGAYTLSVEYKCRISWLHICKCNRLYIECYYSFVGAMPISQGVYFIIVSGYSSYSGAYSLSVTQNTGSPPCTTANAITSLPFTSAFLLR